MGYESHPINGCGGIHRDSDDHQRLRHARDRHQGFPVGRYTQPAPMLFTRDGHNVFLGDMYRGFSAFLLCGGPSLTTHDLSQLNHRGILTLAVNNAAAVYRPHLWTGVDDPGNFVDAVWYDPGILKFVPLCHMEKQFTVRDAAGKLVPSTQRVGDMPGVFGFRRNENFVAEQFLYEDTFNWGNHSNVIDAYGNKGSRSVMLVALRLLFYLGVRTIYLLGCDFRMQPGKANYAFEQSRSAASVRGNNETYRILNSRLRHLQPHLESEGCQVFNCTPESGLTAFPYLSYEEAIAASRSLIPERIETDGMYDRIQRAKDDAARDRLVPPSPVVTRPTRAVTTATVKPVSSADPNQIAVPPLTLVVAVNRRTQSVWQESLASWLRWKPQLTQLPLVLLCDDTCAKSARESVAAFPHVQEIQDVTADAFYPSHEDGRIRLNEVLSAVTTPWYWLLSPRAIATDGQDSIRPEWFQPDAQGSEPVLVAPPWGYSKPADILTQLSQWAGSAAVSTSNSELEVTAIPSADRVRHDSLATWCLFGNTAWTRETLQTITPELPRCTLGTFLAFVAARRQSRIHRFPFKNLGWEYSYGRASRISTRSREIQGVVSHSHPQGRNGANDRHG